MSVGLNGTNQYLRITSGLPNHNASYWITGSYYHEDKAGSATVWWIGGGGVNANYDTLYASTNSLIVASNNGAGYHPFTLGTLANNTLYFWAVVRDSGADTLTGYLWDSTGTLIASGTPAAGSGIGARAAADGMALGSWDTPATGGGPADFAKGRASATKMGAAARTQAQLEAELPYAVAQYTTNLYGEWWFQQGDAAPFEDKVNANDWIPANSPTDEADPSEVTYPGGGDPARTADVTAALPVPVVAMDVHGSGASGTVDEDFVFGDFTVRIRHAAGAQSGQFRNPATGADDGEWWIEGPVDILDITPTPTTSTPFRNGAMLDPVGTAVLQGLENYGDASSTYSSTVNFGRDVVLSAGDGVTITPAAGSYKSLVLSKSANGASTSDPVLGGCVYTIVASDNIPVAGDYRPWDAGPTKQVGYKNIANELTSVLQNFANAWAGGDVTAVGDRVVRYGGVNINTIYGNTTYPTENRARYYRDFNLEMSYAFVLLNSNQRTTAVMRGIIQRGIDYYGAWANGCRWQATASSGHSSGRLMVIQAAGKMIGDLDMVNAYDLDNDPVQLVEVCQTFVVAETSAGVYNFGYGGYDAGDVGLAEWGNYHCVAPQYDLKAWAVGNDYRVCCSMLGWLGMLFGIRVMGLQALWDHDVLFDYALVYRNHAGSTLPSALVLDAIDAHWDDILTAGPDRTADITATLPVPVVVMDADVFTAPGITADITATLPMPIVRSRAYVHNPVGGGTAAAITIAVDPVPFL